MALSDLRVRQTSELIFGAKLIKLSGWEEPLVARVEQHRREEVRKLRQFARFRALTAPCGGHP